MNEYKLPTQLSIFCYYCRQKSVMNFKTSQSQTIPTNDLTIIMKYTVLETWNKKIIDKKIVITDNKNHHNNSSIPQKQH